MEGRFCITFTGGERIGDVLELAPREFFLVGRSHSADIRVKEADVSGRHLEILFDNGEWGAKNTGRYGSKVDGLVLAGDSVAKLRKGSVVEIGSKVRFRIDFLPVGGNAEPASVRDGTVTQTIATNFTAGETVATRFAGSETVATVAGTLSDGKLRVVQGCVEESATIDAFSLMESVKPSSEQGVTAADSGIAMGIADSDAETADGEPQNENDVLHRAELFADESPKASFPSSRDVTDVSAGFAEEGAADQSTDVSCVTGDGETQELQTRIGSYEEILERKRQLERRVAAKHWRFGIFVALVLAAFGALWFASASRKNVSDVEGPFSSNGKADVVFQKIYDADGGLDMFLECPRNDSMREEWSADSNRFELATWIGRDRDVPFRLTFFRSRDTVELKLSVEESFARWMGDRKADGFAFPDRTGHAFRREFWEDVFPGWIEVHTQCGIPFMRSEFTRTVGSVEWRGMCYWLRNGDTAYCVLSEIPESFWKRGGYRIENTPFFGLYRRFVDRQWDSPGKAGLLSDFDEDALVAKVRHELTAKGTRAWPQLEKWIDTLMVMTWGGKGTNAKSAREYLDAFMTRKSLFYNERKLAYGTARLNRDEKRMRRIFLDCREMFSVLKHDRRSNQINDPEVWGCLNQQ